ncbi:MAG TPA: triose-phosphate isomerase [Candidatus Marinimicrobia bacterium]|nr:triose-phosphate isomerase [Candidatus Neomarinimicrobiota bacterium]
MMKSQYVIAANWKMNMTLEECEEFLDKFKNLLLDIPESKVIFCPPFSALFTMNVLLEGTSYVLGAQNVYWEDKGAFTGEVSAEMLISCNVSHVIIGHSERRQLFGETNETVNKRTTKTLSSGLTPIMCIGETIEQRNNDETLAILKEQLMVGLNGIKSENINKMIFAYEPVWAIGTGERAEPDQIAEAHHAIRNVLTDAGATDAASIPILYGGSVNSKNVKELLKIKEVNGYLIGGASLDAEEFVSIIHQTENHIKE